MGVVRAGRCVGAVRLAMLAVLALGTSAPAAAGMCVDVSLQFNQSLPPQVLVEALKSETASIWAPYDVRIEWISKGASSGCGVRQGSFAVLIDQRHRLSAMDSHPTLASTRMTAAGIEQAPIRVDYRAVTQLLEGLTAQRVGYVLRRWMPGAPDLGRALGRALAHEIGHVLLAARHHQRQGLMRASFSAEDLLVPGRTAYTLSPAEVARLRTQERALNPWGLSLQR